MGHTAPSDKLNIAGIDVGDIERRNLANMNTENIVTLCNVDWHYAAKTFDDYPKAKRFKDWRVMFDEMGKTIDAIMVATPDHTHAGVAAHTITLGKHAYMQKPLTYSVYESRLLTRLAKKHKINGQPGQFFRLVQRDCRMGTGGSYRRGIRSALLDGSSHLATGIGRTQRRRSRSPDIGLGLVHRSGRKTAVRSGIYSMELAWILGFRNGSIGRHGMPYHGPSVLGAGFEISDQCVAQLYFGKSLLPVSGRKNNL